MWWGGGEINRETYEVMWDCPSLNDERETSERAGGKGHSDGSGQ